MTFYAILVVFRLRAGVFSLTLASCCGFGFGQEVSRPGPPVTGARFQRQLQQPVEITWVNAPLRQSLLRLAASQRVAVFLDRRVDPEQIVDLNLTGTLKEGLDDIAARQGCTVSVVSSVVYIGPKETTDKLATLLEINRARVRHLTSASRRQWQRRARVEWPRLAEPRAEISKWIREAGVRLNGSEQIPHDLWPEVRLPSLSLVERLTIALAGFDLTVSINRDGSADVVSMPPRVTLSRRYTFTDSQLQRLDELKQLYPEVKMKLDSRRVTIVGRSEAHQAVTDWLKSPAQAPERKKRPGAKRYTLNVENQRIEGVLKSLCRQLDLKLELDALSLEQRGRRVSLQVRDATLDQLLTNTVKNAGLKYRLDGKTLTVTSP